MGNFFVMSIRCNKCSASDFGFIINDANTAINPNDNSLWVKCALYDFGWGKENGFYKAPLPDFDTLINLVLYSTDREDMYGAAAVILDKFADELLCQCEMLMIDCRRKKDFKKLVELFDLKTSTNRSSITQKTYRQIQDDYMRWKKVSEIAKRM